MLDENQKIERANNRIGQRILKKYNQLIRWSETGQFAQDLQNQKPAAMALADFLNQVKELSREDKIEKIKQFLMNYRQ